MWLRAAVGYLLLLAVLATGGRNYGFIGFVVGMYLLVTGGVHAENLPDEPEDTGAALQ